MRMSFTRWKRSTSDPPPPPPAPPPSEADRRGARDRRERIATAVLAGIAANPSRQYDLLEGAVYARQAADRMILELDKEGGR